MPSRRDLMRALAAAPLTADAPLLRNSGLRLVPANQVSKRKPEHPKVGVRAFLSILFRDAEDGTAQPSNNVTVQFTDPTGEVTVVALTESVNVIGHYTGSFIWTMPGEWTVRVLHGLTPEVADEKGYYVVA